MQVHNDINQLPEFRRAVLTIGSFDGVHRGHQKILAKVREEAAQVGGESIVITFHPHPRLVVDPGSEHIRLLTTIEEKIHLLRQYGIDHLVVVPFTLEFAQMSADEYIESFLIGRFHPHTVVIGYDHRFGHNRQGDINFMKWYGRKAGFRVVEIPPQLVDEVAVSSTRIREAIRTGDIRTANKLLGHYFPIIGPVVHGKKMGRELGFPTANVEVREKEKLLPPDGIYAAFVTYKNKRHKAALYIGRRPTVDGGRARAVEVHIFDFNKEIYHDRLIVEVVDFIRPDQRFESADALRQQIQRDLDIAKNILDAAEEEEKTTRRRPTVAIVLLNYNTRHLLRQYLPHVLATDYPNLKVVVADNGSTDGSADFVAQEYPEIQVIRLSANKGYAGGYNEALRHVTADYYALVNTDVRPEPDWLGPLIDWMERHPNIAAAMPKVRWLRKQEYFEYAGAAGGFIDALGYPFCRGRIFGTLEKDEGQYDEAVEVFWASGAAFVVRADRFHAFGGFDETFFAHVEEIDLCWRFKRAGYRVIVEPESVVWHLGGQTLGYGHPRKTFLNFRNSLLTLLKNEPAARLWWLLPLRLVLDGLAALMLGVQQGPQHVWAILKAHLSFYRLVPAFLRKRKATEETIARHSIGPDRSDIGRYPGSILVQYYLLRHHTFRQLQWTRRPQSALAATRTSL